MKRFNCIFPIIAFFVVGGISMAGATPPPNYPVEAFDEVTQCMSDPTCMVPVEERIEGDVGLAENLTYRNPVCIEGCIIVCTIHACWCEADDKCD